LVLSAGTRPGGRPARKPLLARLKGVWAAKPRITGATGTTPAARRIRRRLPVSPLTLRILAVNMLALAILVVGLLYLGQYQDNLILSHLEALKGDARVFAGMVAEGGVTGSDINGQYALSPRPARSVIRRWVDATDVRTRMFDPQGGFFADSQTLDGPNGTSIDWRVLPPPHSFSTHVEELADLFLRQFDTWPGRGTLPLYKGDERTAPLSANPDLASALQGEVSGRVWLDSDGHLKLTAAAPVQRLKLVLGAVLLNGDGGVIEDAIRSTQIDIAKAFAGALAITVLLSLYLAGAIGRPIRRLAQAAERLRMGTGREDEIPDFTSRRDEIGELSLALREMTGALRNRMDAIEQFAADVAHELKNPLSSLASAVETVGRVTDPLQQQRLLGIIREDVTRLDRLISDISNASRLDAELSRAESHPVELRTLLETLVEIHRSIDETRPGFSEPVTIVLDTPAGLVVRGLESRLGQVFQNLIANAVSFSPPGGTVWVSATRSGGKATVIVEDQGPGIPPAKLDAIFDRFYSERPSGEAFGTHSGLGLSISKQIVETLAGRVYAENRIDDDGAVAGARFVVELPLA
jgi:two-component system, OmpR family, sensor histidine kinase ChvG